MEAFKAQIDEKFNELHVVKSDQEKKPTQSVETQL